MANEIVQRGIIGRMLLALGGQADGAQSSPAGQRYGRYGEGYALSLFPDMGVLADEGSCFTVNNAQTGLATAVAPTSFSATNPFLLIYNRDAQPNGKRIYLDTATLVATAAGTAGSNLQCAVSVDSGNRYSSGGTEITSSIVNPNFDATGGSVARVWAGNITAIAATSAARNVVGNRYLKGAIPAAGDTYILKFGGVDAPLLTGSAGSLYTMVQNVPKVIVGPNESALVYIWLASQSAASSYLPEMAWVER
jgi:hypothetical protein